MSSKQFFLWGGWGVAFASAPLAFATNKERISVIIDTEIKLLLS
jgi:hypothetical protein